MSNKDFKFVSYLWDEQKAKALAGDEVGLLVYRSNLLGADLRLTNYGGGNTSCKVASIDPLTKKSVEVMWVKGSGGDLGTMKKEGLAALYLDRLHDLQNIYKGLAYEDEIVGLYNHCIYDFDSKAPRPPRQNRARYSPCAAPDYGKFQHWSGPAPGAQSPGG